MELRDPANLVSPKAKSMWRVQSLLGSLVLLAGQVIWWLIDDSPDRGWHYLVIIVWLVLDGAYTLIMPLWRYRVHRWEATPDAIYTRTGWINMEQRIAPLSRVQTVDLHRGPIARMFGLASVTVTTASAAGPLKIEGLDLPIAESLVADLTAAAIIETGDAT